MKKFVLDTNICIYLIKKKPEEVLARLIECEPGSVSISTITQAELEYGVNKSASVVKNKQALQKLFRSLEILSFDKPAAECYGRIKAELERRGQPIGNMDCMIAGHALSLDATLVSNNVREFSRVRGLRLENWCNK
ncbi:MAG: type II toxin-antitoxin system VapC family toxin [Candidatus Riflebacteria bacterium]|nr:type II toxin-antitoxin system VapC family toxin [Candidatus Riflebacteria bacterium]